MNIQSWIIENLASLLAIFEENAPLFGEVEMSFAEFAMEVWAEME